jgi:hypothetical protein
MKRLVDLEREEQLRAELVAFDLRQRRSNHDINASVNACFAYRQFGYFAAPVRSLCPAFQGFT